MSATLEKIQISWGDEIARVEFRPAWKGISCPWRHLARLQPGQSWLDLPEPDITKQSQVYVTRELTAPIPPEAVAAIELAEAGATEAFVVENWLGLGVMNHELIGARRDHRIWELIEAYKSESGKKRGGGFRTSSPSGRIRRFRYARSKSEARTTSIRTRSRESVI